MKNGVRIYQQGFTEAFTCILPALSGYAIYDVAFRIPTALAPNEEDIDRSVEELRSLCYDGEIDYESGLLRPGFLPKYADGVSNDWNKIFVLEPKDWKRSDLESVLKIESAHSLRYLDYHCRSRALVEKLDPIALFQNWDGGFWQMFTKRKALINAVIANAERTGAKWMMVEFETNYPDPCDVALKMALAEHGKRANKAVDATLGNPVRNLGGSSEG